MSRRSRPAPTRPTGRPQWSSLLILWAQAAGDPRLRLVGETGHCRASEHASILSDGAIEGLFRPDPTGRPFFFARVTHFEKPHH